MKIINMRLLFLSSITALLFSVNSYAYKNTYAVVIGVADYKNMEVGNGDLTWTINDAYKVSQFLMSKEGGSVPKENIYVFLDEDANKADILYYSKKLFAKAKPGDRVIFYFSGHGAKGAFIPYDVDQSGNNVLYFTELKEVFRKANCETKLLIADACYSGSLRGGTGKSLTNNISKILNKTKKEAKNSKGKKQNIAVMLSCKDDQLSQEMGSLKQGVFTYTLIKGLEGRADKNRNGKITVKELFYYVHDKTIAYNPEQTPVLFGNFNLNLIVGRTYN